MVRAAFVQLLEKEPDIEVVGEAADTRMLLEVVQALKPDVLLLDAHMPGG
jgi:chemotaxis response regulator CheB